MSIRVDCGCGKVLRAPATAAGKVLKCPACGAKLRAPAAPAAPARPPQPEPVPAPPADPFNFWDVDEPAGPAAARAEDRRDPVSSVRRVWEHCRKTEANARSLVEAGPPPGFADRLPRKLREFGTLRAAYRNTGGYGDSQWAAVGPILCPMVFLAAGAYALITLVLPEETDDDLVVGGVVAALVAVAALGGCVALVVRWLLNRQKYLLLYDRGFAVLTATDRALYPWADITEVRVESNTVRAAPGSPFTIIRFVVDTADDRQTVFRDDYPSHIELGLELMTGAAAAGVPVSGRAVLPGVPDRD
ncbi:MAG TPA: hypothetical protein VD866_13570 [Urbifossiella sp.]|nr:hypothetical protein [Urbifossiella sp.]